MNNQNSTICSGASVDVPITFTGSKPYSFSYTFDGLNPTTINNIYADSYIIPATTSGVYALTSISGGGCSGTDFTGMANVSINQAPTALISNSTITLCAGQSTDIPIHLTGTAPWNLTYTVDSGNPISVNNIFDNTYALTISTAGTYQVSAISDANCDVGTFSGTAQVSTNPIPTAAIVPNTSTLCSGETANLDFILTGIGPFNFTCTVNATDTIFFTGITATNYYIPTSQAGTYSLVSVSAAGCNGEILPGDAVINVNPAPTAAITNGNIAICEGQTTNISFDLIGSPPWNLTYTMDGVPVTEDNIMSTPYVINVGIAGVYQVTSLTDMICGNYTFSGTAIVTINIPTIAGFNYTVNNTTVTFNNVTQNADTYLWSFGDGQTSNLAIPTHTYSSEGIYYVSLTASNASCGEVIVFDTINLITTAIEDINSAVAVSIYPNPTNGVFTLDICNPNSTDIKIEIVNSIGQEVYTKNLNSNKHSEQINLGGMASGVYFIKLLLPDMTKTTKLILTH
ncbi:MAG: T9SS type A sorting domain-containing protein, partial [Bacteroidota bacterium]